MKFLKSVNDFWSHLWNKKNNEELQNGNSSLLVANNISVPDETTETSVEPDDTETNEDEKEKIAYSRARMSYLPNIYVLGEDGVQKFCEVFIKVAE